MTEVHTSAPGKAVVAGEYAVLNGAPAIAMAVNRRARVQIIGTGNSAHSVSAPGYLAGSHRFELDSGGHIRWLNPLPGRHALSLFEVVWARSGMTKENGLSFVLDTTDFFDSKSSSKLGLGSSAALATALAAALVTAGSLSCPIDLLAADAHRDFQSGAGSGIDIAAAMHGGLIAYQVGKPAISLQWPDGLAYRLLWSGHAVSTTDKLARMPSPGESSGGDRLADTSRDVSAAWQTGDNEKLLSEMLRYTNELRAFSIDHELGIFEAGHQELTEMARHFPQIVYKPCGAGGGDIGIVLGQSNKDVDLFAAAAAETGYTPLDISLDPDGILVAGGSLC